jgi:hydrogenase maturation protease
MCDPESRIQVVACHQLNPEIAEAVAETQAVIFVDASVKVPPGQVSVSPVVPDRFSPAFSSHGLEPPGLLATAAELFGQAPPAKAVLIGAASFDSAMTLTPEVQAGLKIALRVIEREIDKYLQSHA